MDFIALASECAPWVAPQTLEAIVKTESHFKPLAIGVNGGARLQRQPENREEAVVTAQWLLDNGYNIDLGLGQVNSANLSKTGLTIEDAFDPCKNLAAAGTIFGWNYQDASRLYPGDQALYAALSAYNTGSFSDGITNGYVQKVLNNMSTPAAAKAQTAPAVEPIPLIEGAKRPAKPQAKAQDPIDQPVKLKLETAQQAPTTDVYGTHNPDVMVYR